jgi:hypothetical protein
MQLRYQQVTGWQDMKEALAWQQGQRDMLAKCIAAVEAVQPRFDNFSWGLDADEDGDLLRRDDAIAALRALQEKQ